MKTKYEIVESPDGNGGLFKALADTNALEDMKRRNLKYLHVYCVDNILVRVADPVFIGYSISSNVLSSVKVVMKNDPNESVGIICKVNGKYGAIEYSEISNEDIHRRAPNGTLLFNAANICNHYFQLSFLESLSKSTLPFHVAKKKIQFLNSNKEIEEPLHPNGIKLEMFLFDCLEYVRDIAVLYVNRKNEFSPLKNAPGESEGTPEHCRKDLMSLCRTFLKESKCNVDESESDICEISPLRSYAGENLSHIKNVLKLPIYINNETIQ